MIEYSNRVPANHEIAPIWRPVPIQALREDDFRFDQYHYKINGIRYTIRNREFYVEVEREKIWAMLGGR